MRFFEEKRNAVIIDNGFKLISDFEKPDLISYIFFCGSFSYFNSFHSTCLNNMRKYGIQALVLTKLKMYRERLITKERTEEAYITKLKHGKVRNFVLDYRYFGSVNDESSLMTSKPFLSIYKMEKKLRIKKFAVFFYQNCQKKNQSLLKRETKNTWRLIYTIIVLRTPLMLTFKKWNDPNRKINTSNSIVGDIRRCWERIQTHIAVRWHLYTKINRMMNWKLDWKRIQNHMVVNSHPYMNHYLIHRKYQKRAKMKQMMSWKWKSGWIQTHIAVYLHLYIYRKYQKRAQMNQAINRKLKSGWIQSHFAVDSHPYMNHWKHQLKKRPRLNKL